MPVWIKQSGTDVEIAIKVVPGASRSKIVGLLGDALKTQIAAPPEGGKANAALQSLLAKQLGVRATAVAVVSGAASARKKIRVRDITVATARERLGI
jgi:uncharacterized protein (TIGR00251 family)